MTSFHLQIPQKIIKYMGKIRVRIILTTVYLIYLFSGLSFVILFPTFHFLSFKPGMRAFVNDVLCRWYLLFLVKIIGPVFGVYKIVELSGFDVADEKRPLVIVSNHRSWFEGILLLSVLPKTGVLMKSGYTKQPWFASLVKHSNFISIETSSLDSLSSAKNRCSELISNGYNILIFPEGTRARSSRMQPFKDLAFRLSINNQIPVLPVIVHTDFPFLAKIPDSVYPPNFRITLRALDPVSALERERPVDFAERVRKIMADQVKALDKGTVWEKL